MMEIVPNSLEHLILEGAAEVAGINLETGQITYRFTPALAEVSPEMYRIVTGNIYSTLMSIWEKGLLEVDLTEENPELRPTEMAFAEKLPELSAGEKMVLDHILRYYDEEN